jgi:hypothetical protein
MKEQVREVEVAVYSVLRLLREPVWIKDKTKEMERIINREQFFSSVILPVFSSAVTRIN